MDKSRALALLEEYTAQQWGLVTAAQAVGAGVDRVTLTRLADAGHLEPVHRGVYAAATVPADRLREEQATWLALNPTVPAWGRSRLDPDGGVLSHRSAAWAHSAGDMLASTIELTVPRRRTTRAPTVRLRRAHLQQADITLVDGLPVTTLERTVADLMADRVDATHLAQVIADGARAESLDLPQLASRIAQHGRRYGIPRASGEALLDHLLDQIGLSRGDLASRPNVAPAELLPALNFANLMPKITTGAELLSKHGYYPQVDVSSIIQDHLQQMNRRNAEQIQQMIRRLTQAAPAPRGNGDDDRWDSRA